MKTFSYSLHPLEICIERAKLGSDVQNCSQLSNKETESRHLIENLFLQTDLPQCDSKLHA